MYVAYAEIVRGGDTWFRLEIRDLEYPARDYDEFEITLTDRNGHDLYEETWSHNTPARYTFREIRNPPVNGFVYVYTRAKYRGRWWSSGDTSYTFSGNQVIDFPDDLTGLKVDNYTGTTVSLSWDRARGADGYYVDLNGKSHGETSRTSYTYYGLKPNTFYTVYVTPYNEAGESRGDGFGVMTVADRPDNFHWTYPKVSGKPVYRTVTIDGKSKAQILVAWEWNNFIDRINEFREYKGLSKYNFTRAVTNQPFKKIYLEQARSAIRDMNPNVASITSGNIVHARDFNNLRDYLNAIM